MADPENTRCDGHLVVMPDPDTASGYPDCPCKARQDTLLCNSCSALVLAVEARRPCPDGGRHYGDNIHYPAVCVHDRGEDHLYIIAEASNG